MQHSTTTLVPTAANVAHVVVVATAAAADDVDARGRSKSSKSGKEQACKRVGSLKVDVKKIKSNIMRSKR
jgi:hypothetical protein